MRAPAFALGASALPGEQPVLIAAPQQGRGEVVDVLVDQSSEVGFQRIFQPHAVFYVAVRKDKTQSFEPPSTRMVSPVIQRASCEARNATTEPTSSGWPIRLSACMPRTKDLPSSVLTRFDMSVSITPGATALTRMPRGPSAAAKYFTSVSIAPFVAA